MAAFGRRILRFLLALVLISQLASMVECSNRRDPDDYDDLDDEEEDYIIEVDDLYRHQAAADKQVKTTEKIPDVEYYHLMRPRLGHFERFVELRNLYEDYFDKLMKTKDASLKKMDTNEDWRSLRPAPEFCVSFLKMFKSQSYKMNTPLKIIPLDACLEWIFLDQVDVPQDHPDYDRTSRAVKERELDLNQIQSSHTQNSIRDLRTDTTLESIYRSTLFSKSDVYETVDGKRKAKDQGVSRRMRLKLKKYLLRLLDINNQNPSKGCHSLWLDAYTSFMEQVYLDCAGKPDCEHFGDERLDEDPYFRLIATSTIQASTACYNTMQNSILSLMKNSYDSKASVVTRAIRFTSAKSEYDEQKWSREMVKILQLVNGQQQISLGEVVRKLWEIKATEGQRDREESTHFLAALGEYAIANADMKTSNDDPQGIKRYARAMTRLCKPYIDEKLFLAKAGAIDLDEEEIKNKEPFLFYHLIYSLIRLTNHESIYKISKDQFEKDVMANHWEALYLTTFACQLMSTTTGELSADTNENAYEVSFQYDWRDYVDDWPLQMMKENMMKVAGKPDQSVVKISSRGKLTKLVNQEAEDDADQGSGAGGHSDDYDDESKTSKNSRQSKPNQSRSISEHTSSIRSKVKKTLGRFKFGGIGSSGRSSSRSSSGAGRSANGQKLVMSEDDILKYINAFGDCPELPDNIREIYPNLPEVCFKNTENQVGLKSISGLLNQPSAYQMTVPPVSPVVLAPVAPAPTKFKLTSQEDIPTWGDSAPVVQKKRVSNLF